MRIILLAVGKRHDPDIAAAIDDYTARAQRFAPTEWLLVPSPGGDMSPAEQKSVESKKLLAQLRDDDVVIVLDERGQQWSTTELADKLTQWQVHSVQRLVFIIGGAHGVTSDLVSRAHAVWSLGRLVFPHMIVRLILSEQLYRAATIVRGEPYHHA